MDHILRRFAAKYRGDGYQLVRCNCNHFTNELAQALVGKAIPAYVNRTANIGKGILGVMALPSQALGGIVTGFKRVASKRDRPATAHGTQPAAAHCHTVAHTTPLRESERGGRAAADCAAAASNAPVASPANKGAVAASPFAPVRHLAGRGAVSRGDPRRATPPHGLRHADDDILFV